MTTLSTEEEYPKVLQEVSALVVLDPYPNSHEGLRLKELGALVKAYESLLCSITSTSVFESSRNFWIDCHATVASLMPFVSAVSISRCVSSSLGNTFCASRMLLRALLRGNQPWVKTRSGPWIQPVDVSEAQRQVLKWNSRRRAVALPQLILEVFPAVPEKEAG